MTTEPPIEVLTPLAACALFGKSAEAVRRAAREERVIELFELWLTEKRVRLIELQSAIKYWARDPWPTYLEPLEEQLDRMRRNGVSVSEVHQVGRVHRQAKGVWMGPAGYRQVFVLSEIPLLRLKEIGE